MQDSFETKARSIIDWLTKEFSSIRSGVAAPSILDAVRVESYGVFVPLNQVASIGIEDARTLRVSPWDTGQIAAIERGITEANLGLAIRSDSTGVRVAFPELTTERRSQLTKLAKQKLEEARVAVKTARDDAQKEIERATKAGEMTEDDKFRSKQTLQKQVEQTNSTLEQLFTKKEQELNN